MFDYNVFMLRQIRHQAFKSQRKSNFTIHQTLVFKCIIFSMFDTYTNGKNLKSYTEIINVLINYN